MQLHEFKERLEAEGHDIEVGMLQSKLFGALESLVDENKRSNRSLDIFYLIRKSNRENAPYMIFFNGGPGIGFSQQFFEHNGYRDFLPDYNIVFMDQRGTGYSEKPLDDLDEYNYFTSRYIAYDAEVIRKEVIKQDKWIVFGQSFGGHVVRKYLELYSANALMGISHGYGECSSITMKVNIEKELFRQVDTYFQNYPEDRTILLDVKSQLNQEDIIGSDIRSLKGKAILDIFAFYFALHSFDKLHEIISKISGDNSKENFLEEVSFIGNLILNSGILNAVVAYIDLLEGQTDNELYTRTERELNRQGIQLEEVLFSTVRLSKNVISKDEMVLAVETALNKGHYAEDSINFETLTQTLVNNDIALHVLASANDSLTPVEAIQEEKETVAAYKVDDHYKFVFSNGNHREWRDNQSLITDIIKQKIE